MYCIFDLRQTRISIVYKPGQTWLAYAYMYAYIYTYLFVSVSPYKIFDAQAGMFYIHSPYS